MLFRSLALWSFSTGRLQNDFALPAAPKYAAVNAAGDRLVAASERAVTLWNVTDGALVAQPGTDTEFVLPPVFSADGAYLAIAERVEDGRPLYSVLRAADGSLVGSFEGAADVRQWWLGAGARYLALQTGERSIRVIGGRRGETQGTIESPADIVRVAPLANDGGLLTVDAAGEITAWPVTDPATPRRLGVTASAASLSLAAGSSRLAYAAVDGAIVVEDTATDTEVLALRGFGAMPVVTQLSDDGMSLVTDRKSTRLNSSHT